MEVRPEGGAGGAEGRPGEVRSSHQRVLSTSREDDHGRGRWESLEVREQREGTARALL